MLGEMGAMEFVYLLTTIVALPLAAFLLLRRFSPAAQSRSAESILANDVSERLLRIEARLEDLADENRRLAEANRFMTTLLADRTSATRG
jgi:hypothetical protein